MSRITFKRMSPEEPRIYHDDDYVGDVYRQDDILNPGSHYYVVHLDEDFRGLFACPNARASARSPSNASTPIRSTGEARGF